ncbi:hypothetical protein A2774_03255 [Candidatus Roizmanbacteria bacterium RIFCSPHIGHO2_01_FULL_39_12c]|uniref:ECF transporter S component n=1 Tax=Candidatus Roizmanbacteria bacterium RIFCSPHIGHO2_01_FULL_39_12c TaxID=1802031 RepID=A0A1F7GCQ8_9BACT|nr:MAG: hypothetical protein A2774_03255 [Candidatus Roizmanbacteria bacterium RIFCSPHIGHO2_01_FULL_39_12c]OGK46483.1 MAG: hypothetical protein A2963_01805 [Candidatus Roizmanbacteria bacterium RIFCSPLOWO2_01_FULL_40_13]
MESGKLLKIAKKSLPLVLLVISAVAARILPHPPNFTPIAGIALFSGSYLAGISAFLLPLSIMFVSDLYLGYHSTMLYVYGSFLLITLLGKYILAKKNNFSRLFIVVFISSLIFFLITNFGVWLSGGLYPRNLLGLEQSYIMAIPFFKNTLLGDLFYTFCLFYGFRFITYLLGQVTFAKKSA